MISIALSCGLLATPEILENAFLVDYQSQKVPDIVLKGKTEEGIKDDELDVLEKNLNLKSSLPMMAFDYEDKEDSSIYRFYIFDFSKQDIDCFSLVSGSYPKEMYDLDNANGVLAESANPNRKDYKVGDEVTLDLASMFVSEGDSSKIPFSLPSFTFEVKGIVNSPLYTSVQEEEPWLKENTDGKKVKSIFYLDRRLFPEEISIRKFGITLSTIQTEEILVNTDLFLYFDIDHAYFSENYKNLMDETKKKILSLLGEDRIEVLTLEENTSYATFKNYNDKVKRISYVFPLFFLLLSALVNLITMTRLIEEERSMIACNVSLGIPKRWIRIKYLSFTFASTLIGLIGGYFLGVSLLPSVVLTAYKAVFRMSNIHVDFNQPLGYLVMALLLLTTLLVTLFSCLSRMKETPSSLMKMKAPKPGKKILLEKMPILWSKLPFKMKSSIRNIFRQKKNLILTSLSIIGSTLLCLLGFGLLDISDSLLQDPLFGQVASSMGVISAVIILFALLMSVVVVYSLTNMNIQERERELATLKVLGYHNLECSLYTFREMLIITLLALVIGLPVSYGVMLFVFGYLEFGSANDVKFVSYLYTFLIILTTTVLVNGLLFYKIRKIDMNDSLKTLE